MAAKPAILFTGVAGIKKTAILKKLARSLAAKFTPDADLDDAARKHFPIVELCDFVEEDLASGAEGFRSCAVASLRESQEALAHTARSDDVKCLLLHTHAVHFIHSQFKSWAAVAGLGNVVNKSAAVRAVITLIDNSFSLQKENADRGWTLSVPQLLLWRDVEQMASEAFARESAGAAFAERPDNFFVLAVNHPTETLAKLVTSKFVQPPPDQYAHRLYMSFSIGVVRRWLEQGGAHALKAKAVLEQNREFRHYFAEHFVAFDPSTIDELPMFYKAMDKNAGPSIVIKRSDMFTGGDLWPQCDNALAPQADDEIELRTDHIREALGAFVTGAKLKTSLIDQYVRSRDFALVDQSHGVVIFRPTLSGEWSKGTRSELQRARARKLPVAVIADHGDPQHAGAFETEIGDTELFLADMSDADARRKAFAGAADHLRKAFLKKARGA